MTRLGTGPSIAIVLARAIALWVIVPVGALTWLAVIVWFRGITLGAFLGWLDLNAVCVLERAMLFPQFGVPVSGWTAWRDIRTVKHRIGWLDLP